MHAIRLKLMMSLSIPFFIEGGNAFKLELIGNMLNTYYAIFYYKRKTNAKRHKNNTTFKKTLIS